MVFVRNASLALAAICSTIGIAHAQGDAKERRQLQETVEHERNVLVGVWKGSYICGSENGLDLSITAIADDGAIEALFKFYPLPGHTYSFKFTPGSYYLTGNYDDETGIANFTPTDWKDKSQPGYTAIGFTATYDPDNKHFSGRMDVNSPCRGGRVFVTEIAAPK